MNALAPLRHRRHPFGWLSVCVLMLHALVPAGFMPVASGEGGLTLMLCPGAGPVPAPRGAADPHAHHHSHHHAGSDGAADGTTREGGAPYYALCAFAAGAAPALGAPSAVDMPVTPEPVLAPLVESRLHSIGHIERAQSARAPPV